MEFFESKIRPILAQECYECHSTSGKSKGGLVLDHREALARGGDSGPAIVPGNAAESLLFQAIRHEDEDLAMPRSAPQLEPATIAHFEKWINAGASDPRDAPPSPEELTVDTDWPSVLERRKNWWSFQPIKNPEVPELGGVEHPIDRFILSRLEENGLKQASSADPHTLARRVYFVLIGLPPTPDQIEVFLDQWEKDRNSAVESLIDELLSSPYFGQRWARHWMDWVRYAETHGSEGDPAIPYANTYRDYLDPGSQCGCSL